MDIVTLAGTGRHVAIWRSNAYATPLVGVAAVCEQQGMPQDLRPRQNDLRFPTAPQRSSAPSRWSP
ncbi:hypothetical protein [Actinomycetospora straminea]|uniref:Uncharacterized protein n=1 Tax=Actinomycetospora straminea TaxID=663607 RepID=A0ABP9ETP9_9PSEU|nr:hypothetical protein [Actinomycetospora straminea]MDD7934898.1 hypothetical protein [Actinomycetospora straminea]